MILTKKTNKFEVPAIIEETGMLNIFKDGKANPDFNGGAGYSAGDGEKEFKGTYPQSISLGLAYSIFKWLKVMSSGDIYLRQQVDLDGREKDFGIAYRAGGALEFLPSEDIRLSAGYSYYNPGIKNEKRNEIDPLLISHTIGAGAGFKVNDGLEVTIGVFYTIYQNATVYEVIHTTSILNNVLGIINGTAEATHYVKKELAEETFVIAFGLTYRYDFKESAKEEKAPVLNLKNG
jgi:opacity protein-like surface antigen